MQHSVRLRWAEARVAAADRTSIERPQARRAVMRIDPYPSEIKNLVIRFFAELGAELSALSDLHVTIRIDKGKCVARSYRVDGLMAMWMVEYGILQFYDAAGNMLRTINLLEEVHGQK